MPVPLRLTTVVVAVVELLVNVRVPDAAPTAVGLNWTGIVIAIVGLSVTGNVAPENVNPAPVIFAAFTVTGDVPVEVSVTIWVTGVPIG